MPKLSNREKILTEGLKVVHERGFGGASVRDIVQAAGVPQGSFTNHFASKEAFGLEIIELYFARGCETIRETLRNDGMPPLARLKAYIDASQNGFGQNDMRNGCLFGNFAAEAGNECAAFRDRLTEIFTETQAAVAYCLKAAVTAGELPSDFACDEIAGFIVSSLQGAGLLAKAYRSPVPIERFKHVLFSKILH
jgi:TetR/AcrR family transcriptional repressor of nem operon